MSEQDKAVADRQAAGAILEIAKGLVTKTRAGSHGDMVAQHAVAGEVWSIYLRARGKLAPGAAIDAGDVAMMMDLLKVSREAIGAFNADNYIDGAGYWAIAGVIRANQVAQVKAPPPPLPPNSWTGLTK